MCDVTGDECQHHWCYRHDTTKSDLNRIGWRRSVLSLSIVANSIIAFLYSWLREN
jgi:hypothetical protein